MVKAYNLILTVKVDTHLAALKCSHELDFCGLFLTEQYGLGHVVIQ